jgi:hypothetical protein
VPDPNPRPEVLEKLLAARVDPSAPHIDATPAERAAVEVWHRQAIGLLQDQGIIPRERTLLDVTLFELEAAAGIYHVLRRYSPTYGYRPLSDVLKVAAPEQVHLVVLLLQALGYPVPEEGDQP